MGKPRLVMAILAIAALLTSVAVPPSAASSGWTRSCTTHIVAVSGGHGVLGNLTVTIHYPGMGRVFISTSPAAEVDTQGSAVIAAFAASLLAGVDMSNYDFYYDLEAPSVIVGGPSAGAAMALATLELLLGEPCNGAVAATGMIQPDTSIGPVGGLREKLEAAARGGARLFIIPAGQELYTYYETRYKRIGPIIWVTRERVTVNLTKYGEELGVNVKTAASLLEEYEIVTNKSLGAPEAPGGLPQWFKAVLLDYVAHANSSLARILQQADDRYTLVRQLASEAEEEMNSAAALASSGHPYEAALGAVSAEAKALEGLFLSNAIKNDMDASSAVESVNESMLSAWSYVESLQSSVKREALKYILLARAYGKLGIAAYYYREALEALEEEGGHYYVPVPLFGTVDLRGLELLATARALVDWALFWANATKAAPPSATVPGERLLVVSRLLLSEARSTVAYLDVLLKEAGADTSKAGLAEALVEEALAYASNPLTAIGMSIEGMAETTRVIHEVFTLKPLATASQLIRVARMTEPKGDTAAVSEALALLALNSNDSTSKLLAASTAVLYAWLERELAGTQAASSASNAPTVTPNTPETSVTAGRTESSGRPATETERAGGGLAVYNTYLALAALVASAAAIAVCASGRRGGG